MRRVPLDFRPTTQFVQDPPHVWCHLDSGSNESEVAGRFVNIDVLEPFLGKGQCSPKATHAGAHDGNAQISNITHLHLIYLDNVVEEITRKK